MSFIAILLQSAIFGVVAGLAFGPTSLVFWAAAVANALIVAVYGQLVKAGK